MRPEAARKTTVIDSQRSSGVSPRPSSLGARNWKSTEISAPINGAGKWTSGSSKDSAKFNNDQLPSLKRTPRCASLMGCHATFTSFCPGRGDTTRASDFSSRVSSFAESSLSATTAQQLGENRARARAPEATKISSKGAGASCASPGNFTSSCNFRCAKSFPF